jgi:hypothetical protein
MEVSMKSKCVCLLAGMFLIAGFVGCSKESPVQTQPTEKNLSSTQGPGGFGISYMKGLAKLRKTSKVQSGENVNFNLGSIKGSTAFYFLLYNVGKSLITNVTLTVSDSSFSVYPAAMDTLATGTDIGMLPVVKVNAIHGTSFDGVGYRSIMKQGANSAVVRIQGTTKTSHGVDTVVALSVGLNLQALVMDFKFYGPGGDVNFEIPKMSLMGRFLYDSAISVAMPATWVGYYPENFKFVLNSGSRGCYNNDIRDTAMKIRNTGNVPLGITQFPTGSAPTVQATVSPGDSLVIAKAAGRYIVDGNHTVANPQRMSLHTDGKFYFQFDVPYAPTCGTFFDWDAFKLMPKSNTCAEIANEMRRLDSDTTLMYMARKGTCADSSYSYTLYYLSPDSMVAQYKDSLGTPVEYYVNETYKNLLTQLRK